MAVITNYKNLLKNAFSAFSFSNIGSSENIVLRALASSDYSDFTDNFTSLLLRFNRRYNIAHADQSNNFKVLENTLTRLTHRSWQGAYAELVATDFLNRSSFLVEPVHLAPILVHDDTLSHEFGESNPDLDGHIEDINLFFDIKCLRNAPSAILDNVFRRLMEKFPNLTFEILAEDHVDMDPSLFQNENFQKIENELNGVLTNSKRVRHIRSKEVDGLSFRIRWDDEDAISVSAITPYRYARNNYKLVFEASHAKKFHKKAPFILVFVSSPWIGAPFLAIDGDEKDYYRAFSRRVFMPNALAATSFSVVSPSYKSNETIEDVLKYLSGILFIEDRSMVPKPYESLPKGYLYLNPNARFNLSNTLARDYFISLNCLIDNFKDDQY